VFFSFKEPRSSTPAEYARKSDMDNISAFLAVFNLLGFHAVVNMFDRLVDSVY